MLLVLSLDNLSFESGSQTSLNLFLKEFVLEDYFTSPVLFRRVLVGFACQFWGMWLGELVV